MDNNERLTRMETKIDTVVEEVADIKVSVAEIRADVNYHIRRTDLLEEEVQPLRKALTEFSGAIKFIKIVGVLLAIAEAIRMLK